MINLDLAQSGYLRNAEEHHLRHVESLEGIMRQIRALDIVIRWAALPATCAGYCQIHRRAIILADWLYWCQPWFVRRVLTHELGHVIVGPSEERVLAWQQSHYPDLTRPPDWGAI